MKAGTLNQRVTFQTRSSTDDGAGQPIESWSDHVTVWADIRLSGGLETIRAGAPVSVTKASIRIRQRSDLTAGMRAVHQGQVFSIEAVPPQVMRAEFMDIVCEVVR